MRISGLQIWNFLDTLTSYMKVQALIIFLSILVYATEQVSVPLMISSPKKMTCCMAKMKCHKKMADKTPKNCEGMNCINCPLANTFPLQSMNNEAIIIPPYNKEFVPLKTNLVSGVYWKVWRPPVVS